MHQQNILKYKHRRPCGEDTQVGGYYRHSYGESIRRVNTTMKRRGAYGDVSTVDNVKRAINPL